MVDGSLARLEGQSAGCEMTKPAYIAMEELRASQVQRRQHALCEAIVEYLKIKGVDADMLESESFTILEAIRKFDEQAPERLALDWDDVVSALSA